MLMLKILQIESIHRYFFFFDLSKHQLTQFDNFHIEFLTCRAYVSKDKVATPHAPSKFEKLT